MAKAIHVYTRPVDDACYPEGLARSVHFACSSEVSGDIPWNKNYGILFVHGEISKDNTIIPMGIKDPCIFRIDDKRMGIAARRVLEDGSPDETTAGKLMLWETEDLISFTEKGFVTCESIGAMAASGSEDAGDSTFSSYLEVPDELADAATLYWSSIKYTETVIPERVTIGSLEELESVKAKIRYSDGSVRTKSVKWNADAIDFSVPGEYRIEGVIDQQRFDFPLAKGYGDPVIFPWDDKWYYISTNDNLNDIGIYVREAEDVHGLFADGVIEHLILPFDPKRGFEQTFWAPEFHVIGGELYILFAVSGHKWGPQCHLMKLKKGRPIIEEDSWEDPVRIVRKNGEPLAIDEITLDMTYVKNNAGSYMIWSYRENIATPLDSGSMLYIASVDEDAPWKLTSEPVLLTRPLYGWENVSGTINNEGPNHFISDGMVYVTYSGGSANRYTYALGLLTASVDDDLLNPDNWHKSITPVLTFYSVDGEFGPGHNAFYTNEDGELMISYHGETDIGSSLRCDGIRRVHFRSDGSPYFQMSKEEDIRTEKVYITICIR
ncbi:Beta-xylosidase, GH43 family [Lachnospiraceae bacterium XBB2008]|nr:Beta-xylosidase, GH43 family [Lachnospiraceae bacterium XBB2008]